MKLTNELRQKLLTDPDALEVVAKAIRVREEGVELSQEEVTEWRNKAEGLVERYPPLLEYSLYDSETDNE